MGLIWLIVGGVALWALVRLGRQTERPGRGQWRVSATLIAAACLGGGALALARGSWLIGGSLIAVGIVFGYIGTSRRKGEKYFQYTQQ